MVNSFSTSFPFFSRPFALSLENATARFNYAPRGAGLNFAMDFGLPPYHQYDNGFPPFAVEVHNGIIESNVAKASDGGEGIGGGMCMESGKHSLRNMTIFNNTASVLGGGISVLKFAFKSMNGTQVDIMDSLITGNRVGSDDKVLDANSVQGNGGGIGIESILSEFKNLGLRSCPVPPKIGMNQQTFGSNCSTGEPWATNQLGPIGFTCNCENIEDEWPAFEFGVYVTVSGTRISHNRGTYGGGIYATNANVLVNNGDIEFNNGQHGGGGTYLAVGSATLELQSTSLQNNYGSTPLTIGHNLRSESTGALTLSGNTSFFLGGNATEVSVTVGSGKVTVDDQAKLQCPMGHIFTTGTQLSKSYSLRRPGMWELSCNDPGCRRQCTSLYPPPTPPYLVPDDDIMSHQLCGAKDDSCWAKWKENSTLDSWLHCMKLCHDPACSTKTTNHIRAPYHQTYTQNTTNFNFTWAYYSSCQHCTNANEILPAMKTQFFDVGCSPCPPNTYSLDTSNATGATLASATQQKTEAICLPCPPNAWCPGGSQVWSNAGYWGQPVYRRPSATTLAASQENGNFTWQMVMLECPAGFCSQLSPSVRQQSPDSYYLSEQGNANYSANPVQTGVATWNFSAWAANNTWWWRSCLEDSHRNESQLLCGYCKDGFSQEFPGTKCTANSNCDAIYFYPIFLLVISVSVVIYCLVAAAEEKDGRVQMLIYFYQLAPSFVGFAELNDAAYVQTILNVINGLVMFNFYATTEKGGTGKTNGGTGFAFCLYRGFSMLGKLGYLSLLPPVICFALMYFFGKRLNKVTQVIVRWSQQRHERLKEHIKKQMSRKSVGFGSPRGNQASNRTSMSSEKKSPRTSIEITKDELREQFARAAVKLWFLFFAGLAKAAASFTECTSDSYGEGRHWLLATIYSCDWLRVPAALFMLVLILPSLFVLFLAFLNTRSSDFFKTKLSKWLRLEELRDWAKRIRKKHGVKASFLEPDKFYRDEYWWWPHFAALFRVFVVTMQFISYMEATLWYVTLVVAGLMWLCVSAICAPHQDDLSNSLSTLSGFCWVLLSATAEPLGSLTPSGGESRGTVVLLVILTLGAAIAPLVLIVAHETMTSQYRRMRFRHQHLSGGSDTEMVTRKGGDVDVESPLSSSAGGAGSWVAAGVATPQDGRPTLDAPGGGGGHVEGAEVEVQHANPGAPAGTTGGDDL